MKYRVFYYDKGEFLRAEKVNCLQDAKQYAAEFVKEKKVDLSRNAGFTRIGSVTKDYRCDFVCEVNGFQAGVRIMITHDGEWVEAKEFFKNRRSA